MVTVVHEFPNADYSNGYPIIPRSSSDALHAEPLPNVSIDAGVLEHFLAVMQQDHGADAFEMLRTILGMAASLKRLNAPRYSIIGGRIRFDLEDGRVTFIGHRSDRSSYQDLQSPESTS